MASPQYVRLKRNPRFSLGSFPGHMIEAWDSNDDGAGLEYQISVYGVSPLFWYIPTIWDQDLTFQSQIIGIYQNNLHRILLYHHYQENSSPSLLEAAGPAEPEVDQAGPSHGRWVWSGPQLAVNIPTIYTLHEAWHVYIYIHIHYIHYIHIHYIHIHYTYTYIYIYTCKSVDIRYK